MARELAKSGDTVHVWCGASVKETLEVPGVIVHRDLGSFSALDLRRAGKLLDKLPGPRRIFVQWVPHGYGYRSVNLFFCLWLWLRAKLKHDRLEIMFHEVWLSFGGPWKANIAAALHRIMVFLLKHAASSIWVAAESWKKYLHGTRAPVGWLPVPSNILSEIDPAAIGSIRARYAIHDGPLIGHFGSGSVLVEGLLQKFIPEILKRKVHASFILIGKGSETLARKLQGESPGIGSRIFATGVLPSPEIAAHISACDLMVQPYVDGISTRRTAAMAALANGRPLLTTSGHSTGSFWLRCNALAIMPADDYEALVLKAEHLLNDQEELNRMASAGRELYEALFDVSISTDVLRGTRAPLQQESVELAVRSMTTNNRTA